MNENRVVHILADNRDPLSIRQRLREVHEATVEKKTLDVADYVISSRIGVERKTGSDFVSSLTSKDNRLLDECIRLANTYEIPYLILENFPSAFTSSGIDPAAVYGALVYLTRNLGIRIIPTIDQKDTALTLHRLAYREQIEDRHPLLARSAPKNMTFQERQVFLLEGLKLTGIKTAERLLEAFETPEKVFQAIRETKILYTRTNNPKGIDGPLKALPGIGHKFVNANQKLLSEIAPTDS